jgi:eukaryotic-like serine/threonine-protein kinase
VLVAVAAVVAALTGGNGTDDAPPGGSPSGTTSATSTPRTVSIDSATYVGKPVAQVRDALGALGLLSRVVTVDNPGGKTAGTVSTLRPTGPVAVGTTITLEVWGTAPPAKDDHKGDGGKPDKGKGKGKH